VPVGSCFSYLYLPYDNEPNRVTMVTTHDPHEARRSGRSTPPPDSNTSKVKCDRKAATIKIV
jgi:hypothetical protein